MQTPHPICPQALPSALLSCDHPCLPFMSLLLSASLDVSHALALFAFEPLHMLFPLPAVLFPFLFHPSAWLTHLHSSCPSLEATLSKPWLGVSLGVPRTPHTSPMTALGDHCLFTCPCDVSFPGMKEGMNE